MYNLSRLAKAEFKVNQLMISKKTDIMLPSQAELKDFLTFIQYFYKIRTGREYSISQPIGREPHQISLAKQVPRIVNHEISRLMINIAPRYGKTEWAIHLIAYCIAFYPGSNYMYLSYSADLATKQTKTIRSIVNLPQFEQIFGVSLDTTSKASDDWMTNTGCRVVGAGTGGPIQGNGAGIGFTDEFGGLAILDDMHKSIEVTHEKHREEMKEWYINTFSTRLNNPLKTPVVFIGQILHEDDIPMNLRRIGTSEEGEKPIDNIKWETVILDGLDDALNALDPAKHNVAQHLEMKERQPYKWWSQYQQRPQPAGGSLFKTEWFPFFDEHPDIITTFITCDTAETSKKWNDATVFSFWGLYKVNHHGIQTDIYALHWLDCWEIRVEPKDLQSKFEQFYLSCCRFPVKPSVVGIEKKSTGATLLSILNKFQAMRVVDTIDYRISPDLKKSLKRCKKIDRFLNCQQYVSNKLISFTTGMKHASICIDHLSKITANDSHAFDDIADTMADAIYMALITNFIPQLKPMTAKPSSGLDLTKKAIPW